VRIRSTRLVPESGRHLPDAGYRVASGHWRQWLASRAKMSVRGWQARTATADRDRLRGCRTRTRKCCVRSLLASFGSTGRELSRHFKYIARASRIHAFLSSNPTCPGLCELRRACSVWQSRVTAGAKLPQGELRQKRHVCVNYLTHVLRKSTYLPIGGYPNAQAHQFCNRCHDIGADYDFVGQRQL
jgi:hypothetical protein